jgi:antitoxin (DNA-binding transcriptional repressor) of toxin-antitoxin stability system
MKRKPGNRPPGETRGSIRELKARLSRYLRLAKAGRTVEMIDRCTAFGRIVPTGGALAGRLAARARSGLASFPGKQA